MLYKTSEHIESLMVCEAAVRRQFEMSELEIDSQPDTNSDPLMEKEHEVVPGMINKYGNRVLCLLTAECAAYCRFCTRRRLVSDIEKGKIDSSHVDIWTDYLFRNPQVREVILSGGDPFIIPDALFEYAVREISLLNSIKVMRIGTRVPVSDPEIVSPRKLDAIQAVYKPVYVGIHFEHPTEITKPTVKCIKKLIASGAILYSQSVFLKDVNDDFDTLHRLFSTLLEIGVRPYYIYHCDPIPGAAHFMVDIEKERKIMTKLRNCLSGIACPTYVIDAPNGSGKIPVPLEYWNANVESYTDFEGKCHQTK